MLQALVRLFFFMLCLNIGIFVATAETPFGVDLGGDSNLNVLNQQLEQQTESVRVSVIPFGDFVAGAQMFFNILGGGYVLQTLQLFNFVPSFIFGIQIILTFATVMSLLYIVSNRFTF